MSAPAAAEINGEARVYDAAPLIRGWLLFALSSMVIAGVLSVPLIVVRAVGFDLQPFESMFLRALAAHTVFSTLFWFMGFTCTMLILTSSMTGYRIVVGWLGLGLSWAGAALVATSTALGPGPPIPIDYVPLLGHPLFLMGIGLVMAGVTLVIGAVIAPGMDNGGGSPATHGMRCYGIILLASFGSIPLAILKFGPSDYANIFWGFGHTFQLANVVAMAVAWLMVLETYMGPRTRGASKKLFTLTALWAIVMLLPYAISIDDYQMPFTVGKMLGMSFFLPPMMLMSGGMVWRLLNGSKNNRSSLREAGLLSVLISISLVGIGGLLGFFALLYGGLNITAHYHFTLAAVTTAFMGQAYRIVRALGCRVYTDKAVWAQPPLFGLGVALMAAGLLWAGTYGAERKYYGALHGLPLEVRGLIWTGASLSALGATLFIANVLPSIVLPRYASPSSERAKLG